MDVPSELAEAHLPVRERGVEFDPYLEEAPRRRRRWDDGTDMRMLIQDYRDDSVDESILLQVGQQFPVCEDPIFGEVYQDMLDLIPPLNSGGGGGVGVQAGSVEDCRIDSITPARTVYDENTGGVLDPKLAGEARALESDFISTMGVWKIGPRPPKGSPTKVVRGSWVDIDKGALYRSRYVAMEIKGGVKSAFATEFFAATPPFSSSKFWCICAVTMYFPGLDGKLISVADPVLIFIDVRRAYFVSWARRDIAVELPEELWKAGEDLVGYLEKATYGARDAAACWTAEVVRVFVNVRVFLQCKANSRRFFHLNKQVRCSVHGDDVEIFVSYDTLVGCESLWKRNG